MHRSVIAFALAAGCALVTPAAAARVDVPLRVGAASSGTVSAAGGVSTSAFLITAGDTRKLSLTIKRAKGSRLEPQVTLISPDGEVTDVVASGGKLKESSAATKIKLRDVPQSGLWRVEVRGAADTTGDYTIAAKAKESLSLKADLVVALDSVVAVPVTVGDGQSLSVTVKRAKKSSLVPGIEIVGPDGQLLQSAVGAADLNTKKGSAKLSKHELPSYGTYTVRFRALAASGGSGVYTIKSAPTKFTRKRPTADAGAAFAAERGIPAMLDGSASTPAGRGELDFIWTQVVGPRVELTDRYAERPSFTAPAEDGELAFELTTSQVGVLSPPQLVVVEVTDRPVADPGPSQVVSPGATLSLDATRSSSRGAGSLTATWQILEGPGTLTGADTLTPSFEAAATEGVTRLGLVVDDGRARSFESHLLVVTSASPGAVADAGREQYVGRMATVFLSGLASRRNAGELFDGAAWEQTSGAPVELDGADTFFPSFQAPREPSDLLFELTVDDAQATRHRCWVHVRPDVPNRAPNSNAGSHGTVSAGSVNLNAGNSSDADGNDPADRWATWRGTGATIADAELESTTASGLADGAGLWVFATQSRDDIQYGAPDLKRVTGTQYAGAPLVNAGADQSLRSIDLVRLDGSVIQSSGGGGLTYEWRQLSGREWYDIAAESSTFNALSPKPSFRLRDGISSLTTTRTITMEFRARDGHGESVPDFVTITFTNLPRNGFPMAQASASTTSPIAGSTVSLSATGSDPDGDDITFLWTQVSGPAVTLQGGPTSLTPSFQAPSAGTLVFDLVADDGINTGQPSRVTIRVDARPTAVATVSPAAGGPGDAVTFDASGSSDPENADLSYSWTQTAGTTLTFPNDEESFTVTAPAGGMSFQLVVNDGRQDSLPTTATFSENAPPTVAPTASIAGIQVTKAAYGTTVTLAANPSDNDPATFTWRQVAVGASSPGVTLSSTTALNPTYLVPAPTAAGRFGGTPYITFGVKATRDGVTSTEMLITVSIYASYNDTTLPAGAPRVWPIISANCSSCHSGSNNSCPVGSGSSATGFGMGNANAFRSNAINVASCSSVKPRIATGGSAATSSSFLVDRINGQGGFMPPGGGGIAMANRFLIMDWIDQGSQNN